MLGRVLMTIRERSREESTKSRVDADEEGKKAESRRSRDGC